MNNRIRSFAALARVRHWRPDHAGDLPNGPPHHPPGQQRINVSMSPGPRPPDGANIAQVSCNGNNAQVYRRYRRWQTAGAKMTNVNSVAIDRRRATPATTARQYPAVESDTGSGAQRFSIPTPSVINQTMANAWTWPGATPPMVPISSNGANGGRGAAALSLRAESVNAA